MPETTLEKIAEEAQRQTVARGGMVTIAGETPQHLYIIVSGVAHAVVADSARNQIILSIFKAGDHFCDAELLDNSALTASVVARKCCEVVMIAKSTFKDLVARHSALSLALIRILN
ncbi:MAG: cyclic nucleotide-binding domain-containing protein, partial [Burkholderiales bacterium]